MAYRRLPDVLAEHAGSIKILHTLRPFAVAMAGAGRRGVIPIRCVPIMALGMVSLIVPAAVSFEAVDSPRSGGEPLNAYYAPDPNATSRRLPDRASAIVPACSVP
jgi:hypothetical protein